MTDEPRLAHADQLRSFLAALGRRRQRVSLLRGAAAGMAIALAVALVLRTWADGTGVALAFAVIGVLAGAAAGLMRSRRAEPIAEVVERGVKESRNVVRTAAELLDRPGSTPAHVRNVVFEAASRVADTLDVRTLLPVSRAALLLGVALGAWALALTLMVVRPDAVPALVPARLAAADPSGIEIIDVVVIPPSYTGRDTVQLSDPERIAVLAGSVLRVTVRARADDVALETVAGSQPMSRADDGVFTGTVTADGDGFLSIAPTLHGADGVRRMIGLTVLQDSVPRVRITAPAGDVRLEDGARTIELAIEATDDVALTGLRLGYTKVTGFGEQFTFLDGDVPLDITRSGPREWTARARWPLAGLDLQRGDIVVYRALATDARPGGAAGESDTYVIELVGEAAGAGGFAGDEELDRYALSQQMVVVLTERLIARRGELEAEQLAQESRTLAAAQRTVRAEFLFMLGGELEDEHEVESGLMELHEEAHARIDQEVAEGRLASQGRIDLARAIQAMSHAVTLLTAADLDDALAAEQTALIFVQRAFSRSRYIMRALTEREQLDASRRLTGALVDALPRAQPAVEPPVDARLAALREVLAAAGALAGAERFDDDAAARTSALASELLRIDPAAEKLQRITGLLNDAARAGDGAREMLVEATLELSGFVRSQMNEAPVRARPAMLDHLDGAISDALRGGGRR